MDLTDNALHLFSKQLKVTFVLPGVNRSGGVRVTVVMAERLRMLGYEVRIVYPANPRFGRKWFYNISKKAWTTFLRYSHTNWISHFHGPVSRFVDILDLEFLPGEVVIAVGTYTVHDVNRIGAHVIKVRYNHGFSLGIPELTRSAWGLPMTTIAVASTLVPRLEAISRGKVAAVIPNGINTSEYYVDSGIRRDGIGIMYSSHPNKAPEEIISLMCRVKDEWPDIPQYFFGADPVPAMLKFGTYSRFPSVAEMRKIYNQCIIWLSVSREEGFCLPLLESMACGCAVVSANNDGARELIQNGDNGFLLPAGDIDAFIIAIRRLIEETNLRQRMIRRSQEVVRRFNWETSVSLMDRFLKRLV
ncbi:MAG: glycosyltransferase family 4 protein, partial [Bacillota bacterium]